MDLRNSSVYIRVPKYSTRWRHTTSKTCVVNSDMIYTKDNAKDDSDG